MTPPPATVASHAELPAFLDALREVRQVIADDSDGKWWENVAFLVEQLGGQYERIWRPEGILPPEVPPLGIQHFSAVQQKRPKPAYVGDRYPQNAKSAWLAYWQAPEGLPRVRHKTLEIDGKEFRGRDTKAVLLNLDRWIRFSERLLGVTATSSLAGDRESAAPSEVDEPEFVFAIKGSVCEVAGFSEGRCSLPVMKGMRQIAMLLKAAGKAVPTQSLFSVDGDSGGPKRAADATDNPVGGESRHEVLDAEAMKDYQNQLLELKEDRAKAEANADPGWIMRIDEDTEFIRKELEAATGLGGKPRTFAKEGDSVRRAVAGTLQAARKKILAAGLPTIAEHLKCHISGDASSFAYLPGDAACDWLVD